VFRFEFLCLADQHFFGNIHSGIHIGGGLAGAEEMFADCHLRIDGEYFAPTMMLVDAYAHVDLIYRA
jgi:pentose-5-phosphate-3-epimerase